MSVHIDYLLQNSSPSLLISGLQIILLLFAILAITNNNPVIAILYLIAMFIDAAISLILSSYTFVGFTLIIVYVGAIAILFVFIVMLFQMETIDSNLKDNYVRKPGLLLLLSLPLLLISFNKNNGLDFFLNTKLNNSNYSNYYLNISNTIEQSFNAQSEFAYLGEMIFNTSPNYLLLTGILLLLGMVGSIHLTIKN